MILGRMAQRMSHMVGQDKKALNQRRQKHDNYRNRQVRNHIPETTAHSGQTEKGNNRGQRRRKNRNRHTPRRVFRCLNRPLAKPAGARIGMFAHHDGVINHDPKRDNKREK